jgi:hypothetical protein
MATVYIAPTAQGSADGTSAANAYAYTSIATAETDATSGGTIVFVDGTYTLTNHLNLASVITYGVTYQPQTVGEVTISGPYGVRIGNTSLVGDVVVDDLIMDIGSSLQSADHGLRFINASGGSITMNRCDVKIAIKKSVSYGTAIGTNKAGNVSEGFDAFLNNSVFKIDNDATATAIYELSMIGSGSADGASYPKNFTINSCTFVALNGGYCTFLIYQTSAPQAYGTTTVKNTIVDHRGNLSHIVWGSSNGTLDLQYSNYYNPNGTMTTFGTGHTFANNINVESQFVDSANGDYRLRPSSPCIGQGTAS